MVQGVASRSYERRARYAARAALLRLSPLSRECLDLAQQEARALDDNHVGTEHIVLGLMQGSPEVRGLLEQFGVTRDVFVSQLFEEEGSSPPGHIPLTPRANQILGFGDEVARTVGSNLVEPLHFLLGVIEESEYWASLRNDGPHHLLQAAQACGTSLETIGEAARTTADSSWSFGS